MILFSVGLHCNNGDDAQQASVCSWGVVGIAARSVSLVGKCFFASLAVSFVVTFTAVAAVVAVVAAVAAATAACVALV